MIRRGPLLAVLALLSIAPSSAHAEPIPFDELHHGDQLRIELSHGGEIVGHAVAQVGDRLRLRADDGALLEIDPRLVTSVEILGRSGQAPLPVELDPLLLSDEERKRAQARRRRRADGLALASFLVPGVGQFAAGKNGLGSLYLVGTLVVDASIALTLAINQDALIAVMLGALDVAARVTSATLARRDAMQVSWSVLPVPSVGGGIGVRAQLTVARW